MEPKNYAWDLTQVPNYDTAPGVANDDVERMDRQRFWRSYVLRNRPCVIKRAVKHWPAYQRWPDSDYLISKIGTFEVRPSCVPRVEGFGLRPKVRDIIAMETTRDRMLPPEKTSQILPRLRSSDDEVLFIELRPADAQVRCLGDDLAESGSRFTFLPHPPKPRFMYSGWAVMFYKNSYSDWHFHPGTDAIMCQVIGTKDVLLLPPTQDSWDRIVPVHVQDWKVYDVDIAKHPSYLGVRPYHVVVEPGDGLFIPVNWWHAVQARPREFGATVPITWNSPYRDLRQPATRHFLRVLWNYRKSLGASALISSVGNTAIAGVRSMFSTEAQS